MQILQNRSSGGRTVAGAGASLASHGLALVCARAAWARGGGRAATDARPQRTSACEWLSVVPTYLCGCAHRKSAPETGNNGTLWPRFEQAARTYRHGSSSSTGSSSTAGGGTFSGQSSSPKQSMASGVESRSGRTGGGMKGGGAMPIHPDKVIAPSVTKRIGSMGREFLIESASMWPPSGRGSHEPAHSQQVRRHDGDWHALVIAASETPARPRLEHVCRRTLSCNRHTWAGGERIFGIFIGPLRLPSRPMQIMHCARKTRGGSTHRGRRRLAGGGFGSCRSKRPSRGRWATAG